MNPRKLQDIAYRTRVPVVAGMTDRAAVAFLVNYLQKANLKKQSVTNEHASDEMFESNAEFWEEAFTDRRMGLRWVKLQNLSLVDWFPRSPGLYHTHEAKYV